MCWILTSEWGVLLVFYRSRTTGESPDSGADMDEFRHLCLYQTFRADELYTSCWKHNGAERPVQHRDTSPRLLPGCVPDSDVHKHMGTSLFCFMSNPDSERFEGRFRSNSEAVPGSRTVGMSRQGSRTVSPGSVCLIAASHPCFWVCVNFLLLFCQLVPTHIYHNAEVVGPKSDLLLDPDQTCCCWTRIGPAAVEVGSDLVLDVNQTCCCSTQIILAPRLLDPDQTCFWTLIRPSVRSGLTLEMWTGIFLDLDSAWLWSPIHSSVSAGQIWLSGSGPLLCPVPVTVLSHLSYTPNLLPCTPSTACVKSALDRTCLRSDTDYWLFWSHWLIKGCRFWTSRTKT